MKKYPNIYLDILGYNLNEATDILNQYSYKWVIKESLGKTKSREGVARVIKAKILADDTIELIISYF